jgi:ankyrin repeat protein
MADEAGATPRELLIEACRRNNTSLLNDLLHTKPLASNPDSIAKFLNTTTDALGAGALHIAAKYGSYEVLDIILDQEGVEIDGQEKRDGDTCLHKAVRYCNEQGSDYGKSVVEILLDAGCDPRYVYTDCSICLGAQVLIL